MKNIVILKLGASNFRGQNWEDSYKENEVRISGKNKSGKSTRYAAWCWLMSSFTDPNNPANSKLFDDRVELSKDTPVASVWAVISIDGVEYRLERTAKAAFSRKRGTSDYEKKPSDEYSYSIDNITFNATEFRDWLTANWDKTGEPPHLPAEVIEKTSEKYQKAYELITGKAFVPAAERA